MWEHLFEAIISIAALIGLCYLVAACFTRESPHIHKTAFTILGAIIAAFFLKDGRKYVSKIITNQIYEQSALEKDLKNNASETKKALSDYVSTNDLGKLEKDLEKIENGIIKEMVQAIMDRSKKLHVPDPLMQNDIFLHSKEKLYATIQKQETAINQYRKELDSFLNDTINESIAAGISSCKKSYSQGTCEELKKSVENSSLEVKEQIKSAVYFFVGYLEEELDIALFVYKHYHKFTPSGFTDATLQNQFVSKIQALEQKAQSLIDLRKNALKNK